MADAGPLRYLVLLGYTNVLATLFSIVLVPDAVRSELLRDATPEQVRRWMEAPPEWIEVGTPIPAPAPAHPHDDLSARGRGEREAIAVAHALRADAIVMDDRVGVAIARHGGLRVVGTVGVLVRGARLGMLELEEVFAELDRTNFRWTPAFRDRVLRAERERAA